MQVINNTIILDTTSNQPFIAVGKLDFIPLVQKGLANELVPALKILLDKYNNINNIIVVRGVGSFTGIRIGLAAAKAMRLSGFTVHATDTFSVLRAAWMRTFGTQMPADKVMAVPFYKDCYFIYRNNNIYVSSDVPSDSWMGDVIIDDYFAAEKSELSPLYGRASYAES